MNKSKKELINENIKLRKYLEFWLNTTDEDLDLEELEVAFYKQKNKLKIIKKTIIAATIIFLCASCFVMGLVW